MVKLFLSYSFLLVTFTSCRSTPDTPDLDKILSKWHNKNREITHEERAFLKDYLHREKFTLVEIRKLLGEEDANNFDNRISDSDSEIYGFDSMVHKFLVREEEFSSYKEGEIIAIVYKVQTIYSVIASSFLDWPETLYIFFDQNGNYLGYYIFD